MEKCCIASETSDIKEYNINNLDANKGLFKQIIEVDRIRENKIPFVCDNGNIMICSPVGNQVKYLGNIKADIVLSGFSTAPECTLAYLTDKVESGECRNSFNTDTMKNGIEKIFKSIGFKNYKSMYDGARNENSYDYPNLLFTQLLCMVSPLGHSKDYKIESFLKKESRNSKEEASNFILQASNSLTSWYKKIISCTNKGSILLVMGRKSIKLLENSWVDNDNNVKINYYMSENEKKKSKCLYEMLLNLDYKIYYVIHASAARYKNKLKDWYEGEDREQLYKAIREKFPNEIMDLPSFQSE